MAKDKKKDEGFIISAEEIVDDELELKSPIIFPKQAVFSEIEVEELEGHIITEQETDEEEVYADFQKTPSMRQEPSLMEQFIAFVGTGLPEVFLGDSSHQKLLEAENQQKIQAVIDRVPDPALKKHLAARLDAIKRFQTTQHAQLDNLDFSLPFLTNFLQQ